MSRANRIARLVAIQQDTEFVLLKHRQGKHDQATHGSWDTDRSNNNKSDFKYPVQDAIDKVIKGEVGKVVPADAEFLLDKMADREDNPDLTNLEIVGTKLFTRDNLGIMRDQMPQVPSGAKDEFLDEMTKRGIKVKRDDVSPQKLHPIQAEISASKTGKILRDLNLKGHKKGDGARIVVSSDNYVIDGHHRWAASAFMSLNDSDEKIPVLRVDMTHMELIDVVRAWNKAMDIKPIGMGESNTFKKAWVEFELAVIKGILKTEMQKHQAGQHDQTTHGSWSGSPKLTILDEKGSENEFLNESLRVVRYEEKGKKPVDYVLFADGEYKIIVAPKPTDGTNFTGSSGIERKGVGALIAEGPKASHLRLTSGLDNYFTVNEIAVKPRHQRRGLASAMLQFHRDMYPEANIQHSDALTEDGKSWATVVKHLLGQHDQEDHGSWATGLPDGAKFQAQDRVKIKGDENIWSVNFPQGNGVYLINRHDDKYKGRNKAYKFIRRDANENEMTLVEQGKMSRLLYGEFMQKHLTGQHDQESHGSWAGNGLGIEEVMKLHKSSDPLIEKVYDAERSVDTPSVNPLQKPSAPKRDDFELREDYDKAYKAYNKEWTEWAVGEQTNIFSDTGEKFLDGTPAGVKKYVENVIKQDWFVEKFGDGSSLPKLDVKTSNTNASGRHILKIEKDRPTGRIVKAVHQISIDRQSVRNERTMLHEISHYATAITQTTPFSAHGVEFARNYVFVVEKIAGIPRAQSLEDAYRSRGIEIGD
jgi:GNAT superfamily N-acetyltransferase